MDTTMATAFKISALDLALDTYLGSEAFTRDHARFLDKGWDPPELMRLYSFQAAAWATGQPRYFGFDKKTGRLERLDYVLPSSLVPEEPEDLYPYLFSAQFKADHMEHVHLGMSRDEIRKWYTSTQGNGHRGQMNGHFDPEGFLIPPPGAFFPFLFEDTNTAISLVCWLRRI
ncbi:MAG: hypothetical protein ABIC95_05885 [archaeon]